MTVDEASIVESRRVVGGVALTVALGIASCESAPEASQDTVPPLDVERVAAETTEFQRGMLEDYVVTYAEYERATLAAIDCLEQAGFDVNGPYPRDGNDERFLDFDYGPATTATEEAAGPDPRELSLADDCEQEYRGDVARVWEHQHLLTPEQREDQRPLVIECLRDNGLEIDPDSTSEGVYAAVSGRLNEPEVQVCYEQFPDFFVLGVK